MILCMPFGMSCSKRGIRCCGRNNACVCNIFGSNCKVNDDRNGILRTQPPFLTVHAGRVSIREEVIKIPINLNIILTFFIKNNCLVFLW